MTSATSSTPVKENAELEPISAFFELMPGKLLDIQINHPVKTRIKLPLIGYETGKYIIVKYPNPNQLGNYHDVLVEGNGVIIRYLLDGRCSAFTTSIHSIVHHPCKYLILKYPKRIEHRELRVHQRVATHIPAAIVGKSNELSLTNERTSGIIEDICIKGCGFSFKTDDPKLKVNSTEILVIIQSFVDGEISIPAKVCNSRNHHGKVSVGIQFTETTEQIKHLLECLFIDCEE